MMNFPAWRCARTSARICWTRVAIIAAKAGSTQYVIPRTVASGVLGGLHSAATSVPAQRNSAASVSAGRSLLIGLPPLRPRGDERRAVEGRDRPRLRRLPRERGHALRREAPARGPGPRTQGTLHAVELGHVPVGARTTAQARRELLDHERDIADDLDDRAVPFARRRRRRQVEQRRRRHPGTRAHLDRG